MKRFLLSSFLLLASLSPLSAQQGQQALQPLGQATLSVTTSSDKVALPTSSGVTSWLYNSGSATLFFKYGTSTVTAATTDFPLPAGACVAYSSSPNTHIAAITSSGTATLRITQGVGMPAGACGGGSGGGAVTVADGADTAQGTTTDAACATDNGTCTEIALLKRENQRLTTLITAVGSPFQAGANIGNTTFAATQSGTWNIATLTTLTGTTTLTPGTGAANLGKAEDSPHVSTDTGVFVLAVANEAQTVLAGDGDYIAHGADTKGNSFVVGNVASGATDAGNPAKVGGRFNTTPPTVTDGQRVDWQFGTRGAGRVELFAPNTTNSPVYNSVAISDTASNTVTAMSVTNFPYTFNGTTWDRVRSAILGTNSTGTGIQAVGLLAQLDDTSPTTITENQFGNVRMTGNRALLTKPFSSSAQDWTYAAAASGISNTTTAVTIKAADAANKNCVTALQIASDALGAATEFAIRDGAGGTVLWRTKIGTAGYVNGYQAQFPSPICGAAVNTLLEVVTLTASITGAVYFNAQGYASP